VPAPAPALAAAAAALAAHAALAASPASRSPGTTSEPLHPSWLQAGLRRPFRRSVGHAVRVQLKLRRLLRLHPPASHSGARSGVPVLLRNHRIRVGPKVPFQRRLYRMRPVPDPTAGPAATTTAAAAAHTRAAAAAVPPARAAGSSSGFCRRRPEEPLLAVAAAVAIAQGAAQPGSWGRERRHCRSLGMGSASRRRRCPRGALAAVQPALPPTAAAMEPGPRRHGRHTASGGVERPSQPVCWSDEQQHKQQPLVQ
jgi:hypothetical protein